MKQEPTPHESDEQARASNTSDAAPEKLSDLAATHVFVPELWGPYEDRVPLRKTYTGHKKGGNGYLTPDDASSKPDTNDFTWTKTKTDIDAKTVVPIIWAIRPAHLLEDIATVRKLIAPRNSVLAMGMPLGEHLRFHYLEESHNGNVFEFSDPTSQPDAPCRLDALRRLKANFEKESERRSPLFTLDIDKFDLGLIEPGLTVASHLRSGGTLEQLARMVLECIAIDELEGVKCAVALSQSGQVLNGNLFSFHVYFETDKPLTLVEQKQLVCKFNADFAERTPGARALFDDSIYQSNRAIFTATPKLLVTVNGDNGPEQVEMHVEQETAFVIDFGGDTVVEVTDNMLSAGQAASKRRNKDRQKKQIADGERYKIGLARSSKKHNGRFDHDDDDPARLPYHAWIACIEPGYVHEPLNNAIWDILRNNPARNHEALLTRLFEIAVQRIRDVSASTEDTQARIAEHLSNEEWARSINGAREKLGLTDDNIVHGRQRREYVTLEEAATRNRKITEDFRHSTDGRLENAKNDEELGPLTPVVNAMPMGVGKSTADREILFNTDEARKNRSANWSPTIAKTAETVELVKAQHDAEIANEEDGQKPTIVQLHNRSHYCKPLNPGFNALHNKYADDGIGSAAICRLCPHHPDNIRAAARIKDEIDCAANKRKQTAKTKERLSRIYGADFEKQFTPCGYPGQGKTKGPLFTGGQTQHFTTSECAKDELSDLAYDRTVCDETPIPSALDNDQRWLVIEDIKPSSVKTLRPKEKYSEDRCLGLEADLRKAVDTLRDIIDQNANRFPTGAFAPLTTSFVTGKLNPGNNAPSLCDIAIDALEYWRSQNIADLRDYAASDAGDKAKRHKKPPLGQLRKNARFCNFMLKLFTMIKLNARHGRTGTALNIWVEDVEIKKTVRDKNGNAVEDKNGDPKTVMVKMPAVHSIGLAKLPRYIKKTGLKINDGTAEQAPYDAFFAANGFKPGAVKIDTVEVAASAYRLTQIPERPFGKSFFEDNTGREYGSALRVLMRTIDAESVTARSERMRRIKAGVFKLTDDESDKRPTLCYGHPEDKDIERDGPPPPRTVIDALIVCQLDVEVLILKAYCELTGVEYTTPLMGKDEDGILYQKTGKDGKPAMRPKTQHELRRDGAIPDNVAFGHFGAMRGFDYYGSAITQIVIGRSMPDVCDLERNAEALAVYHPGIKQLTFAEIDHRGQSKYGSAERYLQLKKTATRPDGGHWRLPNAEAHGDGFIESWREMTVDGEVRQIIGRLRAVRRADSNPARIIVFGQTVTRLEIDDIGRFADFHLSPAETMIDAEIVLEKATDIRRAFKSLLPSVGSPGRASEAAKAAFEEVRRIAEAETRRNGYTQWVPVTYTRAKMDSDQRQPRASRAMVRVSGAMDTEQLRAKLETLLGCQIVECGFDVQKPVEFKLRGQRRPYELAHQMAHDQTTPLLA